MLGQSYSRLLSLITSPLQLLNLVYAALLDVLSRKPRLYAAYAFCFTSSVVFALAINIRVVVAGRVLQGLGGGCLDMLR